jgi:hypothetical protein
MRPIILNPTKATIITLRVPIYAEERKRRTTGSNRREKKLVETQRKERT